MLSAARELEDISDQTALFSEIFNHDPSFSESCHKVHEKQIPGKNISSETQSFMSFLE